MVGWLKCSRVISCRWSLLIIKKHLAIIKFSFLVSWLNQRTREFSANTINSLKSTHSQHTWNWLNSTWYQAEKKMRKNAVLEFNLGFFYKYRMSIVQKSVFFIKKRDLNDWCLLEFIFILNFMNLILELVLFVFVKC